MSVQDNR